MFFRLTHRRHGGEWAHKIGALWREYRSKATPIQGSPQKADLPPEVGFFVGYLPNVHKTGQRLRKVSTAGHAGREKPVLPVAENTGDSMGAASAVTDRG